MTTTDDVDVEDDARYPLIWQNTSSSPQQRQRAYTPYQPGQSLAPILTGETLQLSDDQNDSPRHYPQPFIAYGAQPLPLGLEHDAFRYDAEAYASGAYSRPSFHPPPRSRSPTPAVDDEDFYIVEDQSVHYTGYLRPDHYEEQTQDLRFASSHTIVYDPMPDTPISSQTTLPDEPETLHFGPAPSGRVVRRHKTTKRVQLTKGNYVYEQPVPTKLVLPRKGEPETTNVRYTAVTCDPDEFEQKGYNLRQNMANRRTELFIVITMYNVRNCSLIRCLLWASELPFQEDEILFCRTLYGVMRNIQHLCSRKNSHTWGADAWEKVCSHRRLALISLTCPFIGRGLHRCRWTSKDTSTGSRLPNSSRGLPGWDDEAKRQALRRHQQTCDCPSFRIYDHVRIGPQSSIQISG